MFTATTSICVTGLVTVVTATHWTLAGKIIILVLIQIGGVGLISLGSIIFISLRKKISLRNRRVIQESYNMDRMGGMVRLVKKVLICVFGAEGIGAVCYAVRFIPQFGLAKGLGYSVFTTYGISFDVSSSPYLDVPVSYHKNSRIFHCKPGEIFQCNLYAVPDIDVDRRFPYGNSRWN